MFNNSVAYWSQNDIINWCKDAHFQQDYMFVWFFMISFIFLSGYYMLRYDDKLFTKYYKTCLFGSLLFQLIGLIYFIFIK